MEASLELPVATSVRTLSAKILGENRAIINEHMLVRAFGKASFTHIVAYALARALGELPRGCSPRTSSTERSATGACPST